MNTNLNFESLFEQLPEHMPYLRDAAGRRFVNKPSGQDKRGRVGFHTLNFQVNADLGHS